MQDTEQTKQGKTENRQDKRKAKAKAKAKAHIISQG